MLGGSCERRLNRRTAQTMTLTVLAGYMPICLTSARHFKLMETSGRRQPLAKCWCRATRRHLSTARAARRVEGRESDRIAGARRL